MMRKLFFILILIFAWGAPALAQLGTTGFQGNQNYVYDTFWYNFSAGSVNGTPATPGPGLRSVTDSGNHLSISGGSATFTSGSATNDPRLTYPISLPSRICGRCAIFCCNWSTVNYILIGFAKGTTTGYGAFFYPNGTSNLEVVFSYYLKVAPALSTGTNYFLLVVMRTQGDFFLIQGGAYSNWTLLCVEKYQTYLPDHLGIYGVNPGSAMTCSLAKNPIFPLWWPTPLASDAFTGTWPTTDGKGHQYSSAGTLINGGEGVAPSASWSNSSNNTWAISGGKAVNTPSTGNDDFAAISCSTANVNISADLWWSSGTVGVFVNLDSISNPQNYLKVVHNGTNVQIIQVASGTPTTILSTAATYSAGATLQVVKESPTSIRVFYNNALVGTGSYTVTSNSGTLHGMYSDNSGNSLANTAIYARGNEGQIAVPSNFIQ
jgi:hypothetical protein